MSHEVQLPAQVQVVLRLMDTLAGLRHRTREQEAAAMRAIAPAVRNARLPADPPRAERIRQQDDGAGARLLQAGGFVARVNDENGVWRGDGVFLEERRHRTGSGE